MYTAFLVFLLIVCVLGTFAWRFLLHRRVHLPRSNGAAAEPSSPIDSAGPAHGKSDFLDPKQHRHPRLDLATGFVPAVQQRQATLHSYRHESGSTLADRSDRVYADDEMGDLSDPEADRAVRYPAYSGGGRNLSRP